MKKILLQFVIIFSALFTSLITNAQSVGINGTGSAPNTSAMLDVASTTKGMLIPRMIENQRNAIPAPATGLLIYQTDDTTGFYYFDGTIWRWMGSSSSVGWALTGNSGTTPGTNFIGTTDANDFVFKTKGNENMRLANNNGNLILGSGEGTGTVIGNTLRAPNASGTNIAGANLTLTSGNGTGTGGSGYVSIQTSPIGSTGSAANSLIEAVRIANTGNVIIGSGEATALVTGNILRAPNGYGTDIVGADLTISSGNGTGTGGSGNLIFQTSSADTSSSIANNMVERLRITPSGYVGIGTTAPTQPLEIGSTTGTIRVDALKTGNSYYATLANSSSNMLFANATTGDIYSLQNGTSGQIMTIVGGVPTWQTPATPSAVWKLTGNGGITTPAIPATYGTSTIGAGKNWLGTADGNDIIFGTGNIERMRIGGGTDALPGNVGIGTATPAQTLELGTTMGTIRVDALKTGNSYYATSSNSSSGLLMTNFTTGDVYSLQNGTNGQVFTIIGGVPTWAASAALSNLTPGTGLTGAVYNGSAAQTFAVNYGSAAGTAVQGNTTLTITPGTGMSGGGTITLGTGGTVTLNNTGVTSVGLALPGIFTVTNSPVTTTGTLTGSFTTETANTVFAGPTSGGAAVPTFRALVAADIPAGTVTANNGLTISAGNNVQLGGTLIQNTTITQGNFDLIGNLSGTGNFRVQNAGADALSVRNTTGNVVIGSGEATGVVAGNTLRGPNATGANIAGANLTITSGDGTGTGGSGNIIFQTAPVGAVGAVANTMTERMRLTTTGALAFSGAANYGTSGSMLQSTGNATPAWSTATYPTTTTANQILYSSAANTVTGLAAGANGLVLTMSGGVPTWASASAALSNLTPGTGLTGAVYNGSAAQTFAVNYGSAAGTAVQGNTTLTITPGTGMSGGGTITLGTGGTVILNNTGVTSVGLSLPGIFTVTNSPVTTTGTLTGSFTTETANTVFAGPTSGGAAVPTFRALVAADIPAGSVTANNGLTISAGNNVQLGGANPLLGNTSIISGGNNLAFTGTGAFQLGSGSASTGTLQFLNSTNNNAIGISAGATTTAYNLTLPLVQGAANTVLTNNGAGVLTWASASAALSNLTPGTGLTGSAYNGSAPQTIAVNYGSAAGTAVQGNTTLTITPGTGMSGGGTITLGTGGTVTLNNTGVTSVGLSLPGIFTVTNSPVTTTGTLTGSFTTETANTVFAGPSSGVAAVPTFRALVAADIPAGTVTANNGLTISAGNNVQLGGTLIQNSTITQGNFDLIGNLSGTGNFRVQNAGTDALSVRNTTGNVIIGSGEATGVVAGNTLRGPNAAGANIAGANLTITSGDGTGTGGSGSIIFQTAPVGAVGAVANTMTERMRLTTTGALAFSGAANYGTSGSMLQSTGNATPAWSTATYPTTTTADQILYSSANNTVTGLAAGTNGQVLSMVGGIPTWAAVITSATAWQLIGNTGITTPSAPATYGTSTIAAGKNWLGTTDGNDIVFGAGNIERMRIGGGNVATPGNVGIGTSTPAQPLELGSTTGTIRVDALKTGNSYNATSSNSSGNLLLTNVTTGDVYSLQNGTNGQVFSIVAGVPTWQTPITATTAWQLTGNSGITTPAVPATYGTSTIAAGQNWMGTTDANDVVIGAGNIERMRIGGGTNATAGNVGIGTSTPAQPLELGSTTGTIRIDAVKTGDSYNATTSNSSSNLLLANVTTGDVYSLQNGTNGQVFSIVGGVPTWTAASTNAWALTGNGGTTAGTNFVGTTDATDLEIKTGVGPTERMHFVNSTGNVVIGSGEGTAAVTGNTLRAPNAVGTNIAGVDFTIAGGNGTGTGGGGDVVFQTSPIGAAGTTANTMTERMRINYTGNVIIGSGETTATVAGNTLRGPNATGTNIAGANLTVTPGDGTGTGGSGNLIFQTASAGATGAVANTMTERMRLTTTGALAFSGAANYGTSGNVLQSTGNAAPAWNPITLSNTNSVTGVLPIANGGTNLSTTPTNGQLLIGNGAGYTLATITAGTGMSVTNASGSITLNNTGVTSVGLALPGIFTVTNSPVTTTGTLTGSFTTETANTVFAGPTSGGAAVPTFRALVAADIPAGSVTANNGLTISAGNNVQLGGTLIQNTTITQGNFDLIGNLSGTGNFRVQNAGTDALSVRNTTGNVVIGSGEATGVVAGNTLRGPNATGANIAGANLTITSGDGTGTGGSGNIIFQTAPVGAVGAVANTMTERMRLTTTGALAFSGAANYGTSGSMLQSTGNATPAWSTATYPTTTTANQILYSSATNTVTGLAAGTNGQILTIVGGVPTWSAAAASLTAWNLTGNAGTTAGTNFVGTTDANDLVFETNSSENMRISNSTGNIVIGNGEGGSAVGNTIRAPYNNSGGNRTGADLTIASGAPTGKGASGSIIFQTLAANVGSPGNGSDLSIMAEDMRITSTGALAFSGAANYGTSGSMLQSTGNATPAWSTATYPTTTTADQILYSSSNNVVSGLAAGTAGQVLTMVGGVPTWTTAAASSGWALTGNGGISNPSVPATYGVSTISGGNNWLGTTGGQDVVIGTNTIERMRVTQTNGYIGIGTATPAGTLDVEGNTALSAGAGVNIIMVAQNGNGNSAGGNINLTAGNTGTTANNITAGSVNIKAGSGGTGSTKGNGGAVNITSGALAGTGANGDIDFFLGSSGTSDVVIKGTTGDVGIGTTAPSSLLHVNGTETLGTVSSTTGTLTFNNSASANSVSISAGNTTTGYSLTLPTAQGAANTVLTDNGSGTLTWAAPSTSATAWQLTGNSSTTAGTNFIGTTDATDLEIKTGVGPTERMHFVNSTGNVVIGSGEGTAAVTGNTLRAPNAVGTNLAGVDFTIAGGNGTGTGGGGDVVFQTSPIGASGAVANTLTERVRINYAGNVIIGSGDGTATVVGNILRGPNPVGTNIAGVDFTIAGGGGTGNGGGGDIVFQTEPAAASGATANTLTERMRIMYTGNVGIGTAAPSTLLQVNGTESLGTPSSTTGTLQFDNSSNANTVSISAGTTTTSYSMTLPTAQGAANTVLTNNGSGTLSWSSGASSTTLLGIIADTTAGTTTPTLAAGTTWIMVKCIGGGGAGGGLGKTGGTCAYGADEAGSGGGAGGYCEGYVTGITVGTTTISVTVGAGGAGASGCNSVGAATGGTTTVTLTLPAATFTAKGGYGGTTFQITTTTNNLAGGQGGSASGASINIAGASGGNAISSVTGSDVVFAGEGASSMFGNGGQQQYTRDQVEYTGLSARAPGAGGGGAVAVQQTGSIATSGGSGAHGLVLIYEYK